MKSNVTAKLFWCFLLLLICGCATVSRQDGKFDNTDLIKIDQKNQEMMDEMRRSLHDLEAHWNISSSYPIFQKKALDEKLKEIRQERDRDARELQAKLSKYLDDLKLEEQLYDKVNLLDRWN